MWSLAPAEAEVGKGVGREERVVRVGNTQVAKAG